MIAAVTRLLARLRAVFSQRALDEDFDAELTDHLERLTEDQVRAGAPAVEARRRALIQLGGLDQVREIHRETRGLPLMEQFAQDFRFAARYFCRERGFTIIALLILTIGIGLNTTVFSLVNTVLLRPMPYADAERLVLITNGAPTAPRSNLSAIASRIDTWEGLLETAGSLDRIEAYNPFSARQSWRLTSGGEPESVMGVSVSAGLFDLLGLKPLHGRLLQEEDSPSGGLPRILLTHQIWSNRFNSDPDIVGRTVDISGYNIEVIGVMPPDDGFAQAFYPATRVDFYHAINNDADRNMGNTLALVGRMKPGVEIDQARADLALSVEQLKKQYPNRNNVFANVTPLQEWIVGGLRKPLGFLWIAAALVLGIVGFNLGGLLLARGASRRKELALRSALGAQRPRIIRQLFTESAALAMAGAVLGAVVAAGFIRYLAARSAVEIPLLQRVQLDGASLGFTLIICAATVLLCGTAPAWQLSAGGDLQEKLKEDAHGAVGGRRQSRLRGTLVVLEIALACVLLISAGMLVRSFKNLLAVDLGFEPERLLVVRVDRAGPDEQWSSYLSGMLDQVRGVPGVQYAGFTDCLPIERDRSWGVQVINPDDPGERRGTGAHVRIVTPGLLDAMGTSLVAGRDFTDFDTRDHPNALIINQSMADNVWPGQKAVGRSVRIGESTLEVVGVVEDVSYAGPGVEPGNEMYLPLAQAGASSLDLMVRTSLPASAVIGDLRRVLQQFDPTLPVTNIRLMTTVVERVLSPQRLMLALIVGFAAIALLLAVLGLYGVVSYGVGQQTREIGIRMALGASAGGVKRRVLVGTGRLALGGLVLGLAAAAVAGRLLESLLFGIGSFDPITFAGVAIVLLLCALVAGYVPARRAAKIDPMRALRME